MKVELTNARRRLAQTKCNRRIQCAPVAPILIAACLLVSLIGLTFKLNSARYVIANDEAVAVARQTEEFERMRLRYEEQAMVRKQLLANYPEKRFGLLYNLLVPEVFCSNLERIGNIGDGGKWICNLQNMPKDKNCAIFSLGIANDTSFDIAIQKATNQECKLYAFDKKPQSENVPKALAEVNGLFKIASLGSISDASSEKYTMEDLMQLYNIDRVEILKIDIEGAEFSVMPSVLATRKTCQILIEIHGNPKRVINLLKLFGSSGYYLFSYEVNGYYHALSEYSFIHESCLRSYGAQILAAYLH